MFYTVFTTGHYDKGMYEGPIKAADFAGREESPILRQLRWTDLVARIAATRDTRTLHPLNSAEDPLASFTAFHCDAADEGQQPINRDALSHGKANRLPTPDAAKTAGQGDRETR